MTEIRFLLVLRCSYSLYLSSWVDLNGNGGETAPINRRRMATDLNSGFVDVKDLVFLGVNG